jgi:hypothetical protein
MKLKAEDTNRDLEYSRPFDVHTWSKHPHVNLFVNKIHDEYDLAESNIGKHNLKKVLIDLYLCWANDPEQCIGFHRNNNQYSTGKRLNKLKLGRKTPDIIDKLSELGLVDTVDGFYRYQRYSTGTSRSRISRMWPTLELIEHFKEADLNQFYFTDGLYSAISIPERLSNAVAAAPEFRDIEDGECIILKDKNPDPKSSVKQVPIDYKDNRNTKRMRKELTAYNALLVRSHIDLGSLDGPYVEVRHESRFRDNEKERQRNKDFGRQEQSDKLNDQYGLAREILSDKWSASKLVKRIPVSQTIKFTTRQFANASWKQGGRFYGGWWQRIPSEHRPDIRIDNIPTTEIDYSGHHVVLLYAAVAHINYWSEIGGDVYDIPKADFFPGKLDLKGKAKKAANRQCLKYLVLMLINAKNEEDAFDGFRQRIREQHPDWWQETTDGHGISWDNVSLNAITHLIREKHEPIAKHFGSGAGVKLQYIDSEITTRILNFFTERGVVVLPVHDSYVVQEEWGETLRYVMEEEWRNQLKKLITKTTVFDPIFNDHDDVSPKLKQIGYYDELFDPEEEGGGEAHKAIRRKKDNAKLSKRYREHWKKWQEFSALQGWT